MADANRQQARSLRTNQDTGKTPKTVANTAQPSRKREAGHLWSNIFALAFCIAGIVLTIQGRVRGDDYWFKVAFAVAIGISGAEIVLNILLIAINVATKFTGDEAKGCAKCGLTGLSAFINLVYLAGSCVCFALLITALVTSKGLPEDGQYGCANGFGCANIMAIIACITYGVRVLILAITLQCMLCLCCCAACCACCCAGAGRAEAGTSGQAQQQQPPSQQQTRI